MKKLILDLFEAQNLAFPVDPKDNPRELGRPATDADIAQLEKLLGKPAPPSYVEFLRLHNGWSGFAGSAKLLSVADQAGDWIRGRIKFWSDIIPEEENLFRQGALPVLMGDTERHFLVLDPRTQRANGEMDFIDIDNGSESRRFEDFTAYLRHSLSLVRRIV